MLKITKKSAHRVDLELSGELDADAMAKGLQELLEASASVAHGRMLYTIHEFALPTFGALAVEMQYLPKLFGLLGKFEKCAVVSDAGWLRTAAEVEGVLIPGLEIKAFDMDGRADAEAWLAESAV